MWMQIKTHNENDGKNYNSPSFIFKNRLLALILTPEPAHTKTAGSFLPKGGKEKRLE